MFEMKSEMCKSCVHTKVCCKDKNLFGDVFIAGHPLMFDNEELYKEFKERENQGFPCDDYLQIVRCKNCIYRNESKACSIFMTYTDDNSFCSWAKMKGGVEMSCSKWAYTPDKCDGGYCVGECDLCSKANEKPVLERGIYDELLQRFQDEETKAFAKSCGLKAHAVWNKAIRILEEYVDEC